MSESCNKRGMGYGVWGMGYGVWGMGYGVWPARNASLTSACVAGRGYGGWKIASTIKRATKSTKKILTPSNRITCLS
jgi:hypothetical protein